MSEVQEDKLARARESAMATYESIRDMLDRLNMATDDEAFRDGAESLASAAGYALRQSRKSKLYYWRKGNETGTGRHEEQEDAWLECCEDNDLRPDEDEVREEIQEDPLSVQLRSGWYSPGETPEAVEYELLLGTGGPAVRIVGRLGMHNEPDSARLECQDWFTSWTEVFDVDRDVLLSYAQQFYYGD